MISEAIREKLEASISSTYIGMIEPDPDFLKEVLTTPAHQITTFSDSELTKAIYVLAQYQTFLQAQLNLREIKYLDAKRNYELELAKSSLGLAGKTNKEKTTQALLNSEILQDLEKEVKITEYDFKLFQKIPDAILELGNALKKELSLRTNKRGYDR